MKIEKIGIEEIKTYENNAKIHTSEQIEQIKKSIQEFGFNDPIAIDENNVIIEGHGRYEALRQLKYKEIECIRLTNLTEEQKAAYMLIHNKVTMNTGFDIELLEEELSKISNIDMQDFNFDLETFEDIPDSLQMERIIGGGEKENINYLKYENKKIPITKEEIELLNKRYATYINEYKVNYGFIKFLIGE